MGHQSVLIFHSPEDLPVPSAIATLAAERGLRIEEHSARDSVLAAVNRSYPACVAVDLDVERRGIELCRSLKSDSFTAIVPVVFWSGGGAETLLLEALEAGADEVLLEGMNARETALRFRRAIERASRDVSVHPTTRLPGTVQIERDIADRISNGEPFACCYADLDHFKEFNDRYGYNQGDGVIRLLSRILRDIVKAFAPTGFIGHIGGDDFIFNVPLDAMRTSCEEIISIFDDLIPYQYSEQDRRAGYFLGKDRRGNLHRVPLMTLSIGVVTNQHRNFTHTGRVSELVSEMKAYAKSLTGSVYAVDRRRDVAAPAAGSAGQQDSERVEL
ncbi:MAG: diguanylate cyclase domain-containing protein, partial [Longimicrobiales bacterium]